MVQVIYSSTPLLGIMRELIGGDIDGMYCAIVMLNSAQKKSQHFTGRGGYQTNLCVLAGVELLQGRTVHH